MLKQKPKLNLLILGISSPTYYLLVLFLTPNIAKEQIQSNKQQNEVRLEDFNQSAIEAIREVKIQREKDIWQQEQKIQNIVFQSIYERRMNKKVQNDKVLLKCFPIPLIFWLQ